MIRSFKNLLPLSKAFRLNVWNPSRKSEMASMRKQTCEVPDNTTATVKHYSSSNDSTLDSKTKSGAHFRPPNKLDAHLKPPINLCCMEGCANCVWLEYVDLLTEEYARKQLTVDIQQIFQEIDRDVEDANIRAYIKLEIKSKFK